MSTVALEEPETETSIDGLSALEQRITRTVELLKTERETRARAEQELAELRERWDGNAAEQDALRSEIRLLREERDQIRQRVERLLKQLDTLSTI